MTCRNATRPIYDAQDFCPDPPRRWRIWPLVVAALLAVAAVAWGDEPATCGMPVENLE